MNQIKKYPLDNSAIVHLAAREKTHTNSFRISVTLAEKVCPFTLQKALDQIYRRFPTIVAGITKCTFQYEVIPVIKPLRIAEDQEYLAYMEEDEISACAMRVLYKGEKVSVEIFHALTDGYGGLTFMRALLAEYILLKNGGSAGNGKKFYFEERGDGEKETRDDFLTYADNKKVLSNHRKVYCLPGGGAEKSKRTHVITGLYNVQEVLDIAHKFQVSLTSLLTAVLAKSVIDMEAEEKGKEPEPIQIMVPVNLRRKFQSMSLRNFSLYALPCVETSQFSAPFEKLVKIIDRQLKQQSSKEYLAGMISANVKLQELRAVRWTPLKIKEAAIRLCYHYFGERNSCLSLSNLGEITFPDPMERYVKRVEFVLSPRRNAPYNCGVATYQGTLFINFSRRLEEGGLDKIFFRHLSGLGISGNFEFDGKPMYCK